MHVRTQQDSNQPTENSGMVWQQPFVPWMQPPVQLRLNPTHNHFNVPFPTQHLVACLSLASSKTSHSFFKREDYQHSKPERIAFPYHHVFAWQQSKCVLHIFGYKLDGFLWFKTGISSNPRCPQSQRIQTLVPYHTCQLDVCKKNEWLTFACDCDGILYSGFLQVNARHLGEQWPRQGVFHISALGRSTISGKDCRHLAVASSSANQRCVSFALVLLYIMLYTVVPCLSKTTNLIIGKPFYRRMTRRALFCSMNIIITRSYNQTCKST